MALPVLLLNMMTTLPANVQRAQTGPFTCPNYQTQAEKPLNYTTAAGKAAIKARLTAGGNFTLFAADEEAPDYASNCYVLNRTSSSPLKFAVSYFKAGVKQSPLTLTYNDTTGNLVGKFPVQTLGSWDATKEVSFTLVQDKARILTFKSCHQQTFNYLTRTYVFVDNTVDICRYDQVCLLETASNQANLKLNAKGVCGCSG